jgi:hypothetical protein
LTNPCSKLYCCHCKSYSLVFAADSETEDCGFKSLWGSEAAWFYIFDCLCLLLSNFLLKENASFATCYV